MTAPTDARLRAMARQLRRAFDDLGKPDGREVARLRAKAARKLSLGVRERMWTFYFKDKSC